MSSSFSGPFDQPPEKGELSAGAWLYDAIRRAGTENYCVKIGCTTCGASDFGSLLMMYMVREYPDLRIAGTRFTHQHAKHLLAALAALKREQVASLPQSEEVVRFLLWACRSSLGSEVALPGMQAELRGSFAGEVLGRMVRYEAGRDLARALHEDRSDPEKARQRREQRKIENQLKHEERKRHFRALWLAKNGLAPKEPT